MLIYIPRVETLPGHRSAIRETAAKTAREWRQKEKIENKQRRRQNPQNCQEVWPKANPKRYYAAENGGVIIRGCQLAERILPINVQEVNPPPWKTRVKVEIRVRKEQFESLFRRVRYS